MSRNEQTIRLESVALGGELILPDTATALIVFAHGSGSSRHSPRNQAVARHLQGAHFGTLLFDLLTSEEEQAEAPTRHYRFDIPFLAQRLIETTRWVMNEVSHRELLIGYFGSSTGAAAALVAAAELGNDIGAVVSRGGRPDLAGEALRRVAAPTLLIVGRNDEPVLSVNEDAFAQMACEKALRTVPGASHLFEEPGALELVSQMASDWFVSHFRPLSNRRS